VLADRSRWGKRLLSQRKQRLWRLVEEHLLGCVVRRVEKLVEEVRAGADGKRRLEVDYSI